MQPHPSFLTQMFSERMSSLGASKSAIELSVATLGLPVDKYQPESVSTPLVMDHKGKININLNTTDDEKREATQVRLIYTIKICLNAIKISHN